MSTCLRIGSRSAFAARDHAAHRVAVARRGTSSRRGARGRRRARAAGAGPGPGTCCRRRRGARAGAPARRRRRGPRPGGAGWWTSRGTGAACPGVMAASTAARSVMSTGVTAMPRRGRSSSHRTRVIANSSSPSTTWSPASRCANSVDATAAMPGRRDDAVLGALERRDLLLERPVGGVAGPRVEVRRRVPLERPVDRVLLLGRGVEGEGRRRVDRRVVRVGGGVRALARVDRPRREALAVRPFAHAVLVRVARRWAPPPVYGGAPGRATAAPAPYPSARWTEPTGGRRSTPRPPPRSRRPGSPSGCRASPATRSTGARPCSTSGSARTGGASPGSCAAGSSPFDAAIREYEEAYRRYLRERPALVRFLVETCGNVYDDRVENVFDRGLPRSRTPPRTTTRTSRSGG